MTTQTHHQPLEPVVPMNTKLRPVTFRGDPADIEALKVVAKRRGTPYQTLMRELIHSFVKQQDAGERTA